MIAALGEALGKTAGSSTASPSSPATSARPTPTSAAPAPSWATRPRRPSARAWRGSSTGIRSSDRRRRSRAGLERARATVEQRADRSSGEVGEEVGRRRPSRRVGPAVADGHDADARARGRRRGRWASPPAPTASAAVDLQPPQGQPVGLGVGLGRLHVLLADDQLEGVGQARRPRTASTLARQVVETTASRTAPAERADQLGHARVDPGRVGRAARRSAPACGATQPSTSPPSMLPLGEDLGEEGAVVHLGGPGADLVGHLPAHRGEGPLPGGDVDVLGVGDHAVEVEQHGAGRHRASLVRGRGGRSGADRRIIAGAAPGRQIVDFPRVAPYGCVFPRRASRPTRHRLTRPIARRLARWLDPSPSSPASGPT